jgi:predicted nucleic acid-binding protein
VSGVFVDTSAIIAFLDADQPAHEAVTREWRAAIDAGRPLYTSNYVLVETYALAQRRLGMEAVRSIANVIAPLLRPLWVDETLHGAAVAALLAANRRGLSLVDCTSFELMRRDGIGQALAVDDDFAQQGFGLVP